VLRSWVDLLSISGKEFTYASREGTDDRHLPMMSVHMTHSRSFSIAVTMGWFSVPCFRVWFTTVRRATPRLRISCTR
jgi:hypothetical protein